MFQPHLYSRTRDFADGFAEALDLLDECLLLPIYPAREKPIEGVHSEMILDKMNLSNKKIVTKEQVIETVQKSNPEILLTMGAGDIDTLIEPIRLLIEKNTRPINPPEPHHKKNVLCCLICSLHISPGSGTTGSFGSCSC